jgi:type VI protein secretion system component VasF
MSQDTKTADAAREGKPRPHPLPDNAKRRVFRQREWFIALLVLLALVVLALMFVPF